MLALISFIFIIEHYFYLDVSFKSKLISRSKCKLFFCINDENGLFFLNFYFIMIVCLALLVHNDMS